MSPYQGICCCSCNQTELFDMYGALNFFRDFQKKILSLWSFLSTCSDFEWLKLPLWLHVTGRGHKFPSVAPSLRLWPSKWQLQAGQKGLIIPLDLSGYDLSHVLQWLKQRQWRCASMKPMFLQGGLLLPSKVWIPWVAMGVCCFFHRKEARMRYLGVEYAIIWWPTWGLLVMLLNGESLRREEKKTRLAGIYSIHLLPCHVANVQDKNDQRGSLIKIRGLQKTEHFSTLLSL